MRGAETGGGRDPSDSHTCALWGKKPEHAGAHDLKGERSRSQL